MQQEFTQQVVYTASCRGCRVKGETTASCPSFERGLLHPTDNSDPLYQISPRRRVTNAPFCVLRDVDQVGAHGISLYNKTCKAYTVYGINILEYPSTLSQRYRQSTTDIKVFKKKRTFADNMGMYVSTLKNEMRDSPDSHHTVQDSCNACVIQWLSSSDGYLPTRPANDVSRLHCTNDTISLCVS